MMTELEHIGVECLSPTLDQPRFLVQFGVARQEKSRAPVFGHHDHRRLVGIVLMRGQERIRTEHPQDHPVDYHRIAGMHSLPRN